MSSYVLDASVVLAVICQERNVEQAAHFAYGGRLSAVNLAEVCSKTADVGISVEDVHWAVRRLQLEVVAFTASQASVVGSLREATRKHGLSLGDRACLALGIETEMPVVTGDRQWSGVEVGAEIVFFRDRIGGAT